MSAKAEEFAKQLLETTESGKLKWQFVHDPVREVYKYAAEDDLSFYIKREERGDDKVLTFELTESGRLVLTDTENNLPDRSSWIGPKTRHLLELRHGFGSQEALPVETLDPERIRRFRLYSDLFHAARKTADGRDQAIEKAQRLLARLA